MNTPEQVELAEMIAGVQDAIDSHVRSGQARAGRVSFSPVLHKRQLDRLRAVQQLLKNLRDAGEQQP